MNLAKLRQELVRDEKLMLTSYKDTVGLWTIGVGHLLGTTRRMTAITARESVALLNVDIDDALAIALKLVPALEVVGDARSRALVNMAFNLGPRLGQFKRFLASVNAGRWEKAGVEMMQSKWRTQVGNRAVRLKHMIVTGTDAL